VSGRPVALASFPPWARLLYGLAGGLATLFAARSRLSADPGKRRRARDRAGRWWEGDTAPGDRAWIWIHAASVGEVALASRLAGALRQRVGAVDLVLSANTPTGLATAPEGLFSETHYFPIDWTPVLERILGRSRPRLLLVVETEIWPALLARAAAHGVPVAFANARVSARSWPRYRQLAALVGPLLAGADAVCARDSESAERLAALGASPTALEVTGDIKFDALSADDVAATVPALAGDRPLLLAASTHEGEDEIALDAFATLRRGRADLRLVLAPRHPERADAVVRAGERHGFGVVRWSEVREAGTVTLADAADVLVVDTVGELRRFFGCAAAVFLGGSLVPVGGHNLLEPAAYGRAPIVGPHLQGVADQVAILRAAAALREVEEAASLAAAWRTALESPDAESAAGRRAAESLDAHRGALARTLVRVTALLGESGGSCER
jgi:3-deoxy-D-manno-octulosonic-acid transferase